MSSDKRENRDERKDRDHRDRPAINRAPNETNRNDSKSIRCRIFVGNLNTENLSRQEFEDIFAKHGRVIGCSVHNGYGFVQYEKEASADEAVAKEHGSTIKGKKIDCNLAGDRRKPDKRRAPPLRDDRGPPPRDRRDRSPPPKPPPRGRFGDDDPFAIPGYREARDRYREQHADPSEGLHPRDEIPAKKLRPDYDFAPLPREPPPFGRPVEAPIDCEIIIINKQQMGYAESVEKKLKSHGLVVECAHLPETVPLLDELEDASKRGVLFGIIISSQHEVHHSVTVHILHGTQQEHRNMPLEDAILLVSRNFDTYMQALRDRELNRDRAPPLDPLPPKKGYGPPASSVVPSPYSRELGQLLNIAADGRPLTVDEYTLVIDEFTKIRNDLLKKEGRVPPSPAGPAYQQYPSEQSIALQQAELQAKILSILNPSVAKPAATENKPANPAPAAAKPVIPVLTPSNSASSAFKAPSAPAPSSGSSQVIDMVLSNMRDGSTQKKTAAQNPVPTSQVSNLQYGAPSPQGANSQYGTPRSGTHTSTNSQYGSQPMNSQYSGYATGQSPSWSQAQYRGPPGPGPMQSRSSPAGPAGAPRGGRGGYAGYPGQMNTRGGYSGNYHNSYPQRPPPRY